MASDTIYRQLQSVGTSYIKSVKTDSFQPDIIYSEFAKAFNTVDQQTLLVKHGI